jgi:Golgi phosphoprotein 3 (GPP34)
MEPPAPEPELAAELSQLGEDLLLLSVRRAEGTISTGTRISYGLMGSELIRLAALRRVDVDQRQITVLSAQATGDPGLDAALASLDGRRSPRPKAWVAHPRRGIREAYLERLAAAGALHGEPGGFLGRMRWTVTAPERVERLRAQLDAIAESTGPVSLAQAAFGGLAHAVGLDRYLYPRFADRRLRWRLAEVGKGQAGPVTAAVDAADAAARASSAAAAQAATRAATQAATDAAIQAAVQASTAAAISAAASAASDAGGHAGGHAGHH